MNIPKIGEITKDTVEYVPIYRIKCGYCFKTISENDTPYDAISQAKQSGAKVIIDILNGEEKKVPICKDCLEKKLSILADRILKEIEKDINTLPYSDYSLTIIRKTIQLLLEKYELLA